MRQNPWMAQDLAGKLTTPPKSLPDEGSTLLLPKNLTPLGPQGLVLWILHSP